MFDIVDQEKFQKYHQENPKIYEEFKNITNRAVIKGFKHFSAEAIFNIIRWEMSITAKDYDGFKINNNYKAFYSRMFMKEYPKYDGFFRLRKSKADEINQKKSTR